MGVGDVGWGWDKKNPAAELRGTGNIRLSNFNIQYSMFNIQYSMFNIQYSIFNFQFSIFNLRGVLAPGEIVVDAEGTGERGKGSCADGVDVVGGGGIGLYGDGGGVEFEGVELAGTVAFVDCFVLWVIIADKTLTSPIVICGDESGYCTSF